MLTSKSQFIPIAFVCLLASYASTTDAMQRVMARPIVAKSAMSIARIMPAQRMQPAQMARKTLLLSKTARAYTLAQNHNPVSNNGASTPIDSTGRIKQAISYDESLKNLLNQLESHGYNAIGRKAILARLLKSEIQNEERAYESFEVTKARLALKYFCAWAIIMTAMITYESFFVDAPSYGF